MEVFMESFCYFILNINVAHVESSIQLSQFCLYGFYFQQTLKIFRINVLARMQYKVYNIIYSKTFRSTWIATLGDP